MELLERLVADESPAVQDAAATAVAKLGPEVAGDVLVGLLATDDPMVRTARRRDLRRLEYGCEAMDSNTCHQEVFFFLSSYLVQFVLALHRRPEHEP